MNRRFEIEPWHLITHRFEPQYQRLTESLTSLGNGYMGGRGFFEEGYSGDSLPGIYVGGIWFPDKTKVGWWKNGYPDYFGKAANVPNFLALSVWVDETPLDLNHASITDFTLDLDLHQGLLTRRFTLHQGGHRIAMTFQRFFDQTVPELAVQRLTLANLGTKPVPIRLESTIEPQVQNESAHQPDSYWHIQAQAPTYLQVQTKANAFQVPQFTLGIRSETHYTGMGPVQEKSGQSEPAFKGVLKPDAPLTVVKHTVVVTSRDVPENQLATRTKTMLAAQAGFDFDTLLERQTAAWARRWENCDVVIKGDGQAQQALRFNLFQLWSTYDGRDEGLNIGPKGFSGEKYGGGTYWDTEAFVLPYYLGAAVEKVARNLFEYRYAQLPQAYENAAQLGLKGALFPMVTFDGIENHNEWEITFEELHRNSTIAFAIYNYTRYTGDQRFLWTNGIEVLVGIARFWADRVSYSPRKKQYVLLGVTGPNEFENNVNNNWYTNYMARWVLQYTLSVLKEVPAPKLEKLGVSPRSRRRGEPLQKNSICRQMQKRVFSHSRTAFLIKPYPLPRQSRRISGPLTSIGPGIGFYAHLISNRQMCCRPFGISQRILQPQSSAATSTFMSQ